MTAMPVTVETTSFVCAGVELVATVFRPTPAPGPTTGLLPAVVGAQGFGGVKEMGMPALARPLAAAGFVTMLFDYAGFGASAGEPRQHVDPWAQVAQVASALDHLGSLAGVDPHRLGAIGVSLGGGHVLHLAGTGDRLRCAVALAPFVRTPADPAPELVEAVIADALARAEGDAGRDGASSPVPYGMIPLVGRPGDLAVLTTDGAEDWVAGQVADGVEVATEVTLASLSGLAEYTPFAGIESFRAPVRVVVGSDDTVNPPEVTVDALSANPDVDVVELPATHFSLLDDQLDVTLNATVGWLAEHL